MKKLIAFVILLSLVSRGSIAQTTPPTRTLQSFAKVTPSLTDSVFGSHLGANKNFQIQDILNLEGPRTVTYTGKSMSGSTNTFTNIPESAVINLTADLTNLNTLVSGKANTTHTHAASDVVSGLLPVARGGTGTATPGLVQGTGVTITGTWPNQTINSTGGGGGGSGSPASVSTAYTSSVNLDFGSSGTNIDFTGVTGNFTVTGSSLTSNSERVILVRKTTASQIIISFDQTTLPGVQPQSVTDYAIGASGAPPAFTINSPINTVFRLYINIQGASGSFIPDVQISALGLDNPVNVTANENTIYNDGGTYTASASNTSENIILTIPISANTYKAGAKMLITYDINTPFSGNESTTGTQIKIRAGSSGLTDPTLEDFNVKNYGTVEREIKAQVVSTSTTKVKVGYTQGSWTVYGPNTNPEVSRSVNQTSNYNLYFSVKKGAAGDNVSISNITVSGKNLY